MQRLIVVRILESLLVLLIVAFLSYALIGLMPGDPIDLMLSADPRMTTEDAERLRALAGVDQPLLTRWFDWLMGAISGELGYSRLYALPVTEVIGPALSNTLFLVGIALLLSIPIAILAGATAAYFESTWIDRSINMLAFAGISLPVFWLALLLIVVFSVQLGWLPAGGIAEQHASFLERIRHAALPIATLTVASVGGHIRFVRGAVIEVLNQDYIRTARAKGASEPRVVLGHALRNALVPLVTVLALDLGQLVSGALVTETIFAWPGMGRLIFDAIMGNDYNLALMALLFTTALTLLANLGADVTYGLLDPRVKVGE
jgi:peptide/nickel transport system permease protein